MCRAHLLGVIDAKRHDLFEIHVLARVERVRELRGVEVRRRGDHHGVQRGVFQQAAIIGVTLEPDRALGAFETLRVNVRESRNFRVGARPDLAHQFHAAIARADDADADRSAAPSTSAGPTARVPAIPVATLPIKFRRESIYFECTPVFLAIFASRELDFRRSASTRTESAGAWWPGW